MRETKLRLCLQPPIQVYGVEGRYATALYSAASKQKNLDKVEQELGRVAVSTFAAQTTFPKHKREAPSAVCPHAVSFLFPEPD